MTSLEIQRYWDERAQLHPEAATTNDVLLRELELHTLIKQICWLKPSRVLDAGCGDGLTTLKLAQYFPWIRFTGIDFAEGMVNLATQNLAIQRECESLENIKFEHDNLLSCKCEYDLIITCRSLINLPDWDTQINALRNFEKLAPIWLLIENFTAQHHLLNTYRGTYRLDPIPIREHNHFLDESALLEQYDVQIADFASAYYYVSRVLYSAMCRDTKQPIDYNHPMCKLGLDLDPSTFPAVAPMRLITRL